MIEEKISKTKSFDVTKKQWLNDPMCPFCKFPLELKYHTFFDKSTVLLICGKCGYVYATFPSPEECPVRLSKAHLNKIHEEWLKWVKKISDVMFY